MMLAQPLPDLPDVFPDHRDAQRLYVLPDRLTLALDADGAPRFTLLRHASDDGARSGGILQAFLALERDGMAELQDRPAVAGRSLEPAPVQQAEARLVLRGVSSDQVLAAGPWQAVSTASADGLSVTRFLDPDDVQIVSALVGTSGAGGPEPVELELRLGVAGLRPGLPWTVTANAVVLHDQLQALLLAEPVASAEDIVRAFLGLPADVLGWQATGEGGEPLDTEARVRQAARAALQVLFRRVDGGYAWLPGVATADPADTVSWRLDLPLPETLERVLNWSLSDCHRTWGDRPEAFPVVTPFRPLQRVTVHVLNALPLHPLGLAQLDVELRYRGASGAWVHRTVRFDGQVSLHTLLVVGPAFGNGLSLSYRTLAVVAREGQLPLTLSSPDFLPVDGLQLVLGPDEVGLWPVPVEAEASLWAHLPAVRIEVNSGGTAPRTLTLTPDAPLAWVCLLAGESIADATVRASAIAPDGASGPVWWSGPLPPEGLHLTGWLLEPVAPETVRLRLGDDLAARTALVSIELRAGDALPDASASGQLLTLEPGRAGNWSYWRASVLAPPGYAWRLHLVERDPASGATRPLRITDWRLDQGADLLIDQPP